MKQYIQVTFNDVSQDAAEIITAILENEGAYGFEQDNSRLHVFFEQAIFEESAVREKTSGLAALENICTIEEKNWNAEWESGFAPIEVIHPDTAELFVHVRAGFHKPHPGAAIELVITPKMSFGTGHHATTMLMMEEMSRIDFKGKSVIDFGSGTGVLAILAKKLGAGKTEAIDYDSWCIENAAENFNSNNTPEIVLTQSDKMGTNIGLADVILANINLNIIRDNLDLISNACLPGAEMLFSGVLISDKEVITGEISKYEMKVIATSQREGWLLVRAKKV